MSASLARRTGQTRTRTNAGRGPTVAVFDIGGTWFRAAVLDADGSFRHERRSPAASLLRRPDRSVADLQSALVAYLEGEFRRLADAVGVTGAGVSLGAAIDDRTGRIVASAPLWGSARELSFDLQGILEDRIPGSTWAIVNDVTAAAFGIVDAGLAGDARRAAVVTISSGIALRTIEVRTRRVPTSRESGLQGEIGHLRTTCTLGGRPVHARCDCGGADHLSAFSSGPAIRRLLENLAAGGASWVCARPDPVAALAASIAEGQAEALAFLDAVTLPVAEALVSLVTLDPEIDKIVFVGGVVEGLGDAYLRSIRANLAQIGLYGHPARHAADFVNWVVAAPPATRPSLLGAGNEARRLLESRHRWLVEEERRTSYGIELCEDLLSPENVALADALGFPAANERPRLVCCDANVWTAWGERLDAYFATYDQPYNLLLLDVAEEAKTLAEVRRVLDAALHAGVLRRREPILAVGGGIVLDVVGFAASLYRRGLPYVRVPTTLVGLIDAGIGVKTAVNYRGRKSRVGSYHPPTRCLLDRSFLATLDDRQYRNGLAEAVKVALVADGDLFRLIETRVPAAGRPSAEDEEVLLRRSIDAMVHELRGNLWEDELERLVDFGHSFSPGIEMAAVDRLLHGEAVALDMAVSTCLAQRRGHLPARTRDRILATFRRLGLPTADETLDVDLLWDALEATTVHRDGRQRMPLPTGVGSAVFVDDVRRDEIEASLEDLRRPAWTDACVPS